MNGGAHLYAMLLLIDIVPWQVAPRSRSEVSGRNEHCSPKCDSTNYKNGDKGNTQEAAARCAVCRAQAARAGDLLRATDRGSRTRRVPPVRCLNAAWVPAKWA